MLDDFLVRAVLAALVAVLMTAPLGCFVVWRRMAYFGDATAHAAVLGVAIALFLQMPPLVGILLVTAVAAVMVTLVANPQQSAGSVLVVMSHGALAIGLVAVSLFPGRTPDLAAFLFGDILAVTKSDLLYICLGAIGVLGLVIWRWNRLIAATFTPDLAIVAGQNPRKEHLILAVVLAVAIALAIKVVGVLLVAALMVIPATTARPLTKTPEGMVIVAAIVGAIAAISGPLISLKTDTPAGPTIVCASVVLFVFAQMCSALRRG